MASCALARDAKKNFDPLKFAKIRQGSPSCAKDRHGSLSSSQLFSEVNEILFGSVTFSNVSRGSSEFFFEGVSRGLKGSPKLSKFRSGPRRFWNILYLLTSCEQCQIFSEAFPSSSKVRQGQQRFAEVDQVSLRNVSPRFALVCSCSLRFAKFRKDSRRVRLIRVGSLRFALVL